MARRSEPRTALWVLAAKKIADYFTKFLEEAQSTERSSFVKHGVSFMFLSGKEFKIQSS